MSKELDKKVAELKGDLNLFKHNWSSNIVYAWTLFEEINAYEDIPYSILNVSTKDQSWFYVYSPTSGFEDIYGCGKTAPEAICLAWIKWKGKK